MIISIVRFRGYEATERSSSVGRDLPFDSLLPAFKSGVLDEVAFVCKHSHTSKKEPGGPAGRKARRRCLARAHNHTRTRAGRCGGQTARKEGRQAGGRTQKAGRAGDSQWGKNHKAVLQ